MQKIFGVGFSKTGTTSLERAFSILGYKTWYGHWQNPNAHFVTALAVNKDYDEIFKIITYFDAFSDCPWGGSDLYLELYRRLPESKFILTIREAESWYTSFERMITKFDPNLETAFDTFHAHERYGAVYFFKKIFDIETLAGNKSKIIDCYNAYNQNAIHFFTKNKADFIVFNMAEGDGWEKLCNFLNKPIPQEPFPHENKASNNPDLSNIIAKEDSIKIAAQVAQKERDIELSKNISGIAWKFIMFFRRIQRSVFPPNSLRSKMMWQLINSIVLPIVRMAKQKNMNSDLLLLQSSNLFDAAWYLTNNPDVAKAQADPLLHYYHNGGSEGRDPGPNFSTKWYLDTYEDVKKADINPLIHYLRFGQKEGRLPQAPQ